jgi:hypothetical protein
VAKGPERWFLRCEGSDHVVEIGDTGLRRSVTWRVDGAEVATTRTGDQRVVLDGGDRGAVGLRLPAITGPARRVTWYGPDGAAPAEVAARAGLGGVDLDPEPGSAAAAREKWIRAHPRRYAARRAVVAAAGVLLPLVALWLLARIPLPALSVPWPDWDLPSIPWPRVPWPDLHLPDLPDLPAWLRELVEKAKFVWPVVLAAAVARAEVRRRRRQDERKERRPPRP